MKTSAAVTECLERDVYILEILRSGLGNISAVAEHLKPLVEKSSGRKASVASIGMAVRRYLDDTAKTTVRQRKFPKAIDVSTRTGMYEVAISRDEQGRTITGKIRTDNRLKAGDLFWVVEGSYEIVILTNNHHKAWIRNHLGRRTPTSEVEGLACVTVNWPPITKDIPGIYYRITRALALRQISIQSFHTIGAEMMIFVKEDVLTAAHGTIVDLLNNQLRL